MKFTKLDWTGDITVELYEDGILLKHKDLTDDDIKELFGIIKKSKTTIYRDPEIKDTIMLKGNVNKIANLFLKLQVKSLKQNEFVIIEYKDKRKELLAIGLAPVRWRVVRSIIRRGSPGSYPHTV